MGDYGRRIVLDSPFDRAVRDTSEAFHAEGFDLVTTLDVRSYLARQAHHECRRYLLMEALLPQVTLEALQCDAGIGPALVTTIAIYELIGGQTAVSASPAFASIAYDFGWRAGRPTIAALADRAGERLARALDRLHETSTRSRAAVSA